MRAVLFFLLVGGSFSVAADCGDLTKQFFGIEIGGPRRYLRTLPDGFSLHESRMDFGRGGQDSLEGQSQGISFQQVHVWWYEERVVAVRGRAAGKTAQDVEDALNRMKRAASKEFSPRTVPPEQYLNCSDGLAAQLVRAWTGDEKQPTARFLLFDVEDRKKHGEMTNGLRSHKPLDRVERIQALRPVAESGDADAQYFLGVDLGIRGTMEGLPWLEKSALQGHEGALTHMYRHLYRRDRLSDATTASRYVDALKRVTESRQATPRAKQIAQTQLSEINRHLRQTTLQREGYPDDPLVTYRRAKEYGDRKSAWGAIIMVQQQDLKGADDLWKDYWDTLVLPEYSNQHALLLVYLRAAAERRLPSAMARLSEVYSKGEFGMAANATLAAEWAEKANAARAALRK
jgi:TPR repeat protein